MPRRTPVARTLRLGTTRLLEEAFQPLEPKRIIRALQSSPATTPFKRPPQKPTRLLPATSALRFCRTAARQRMTMQPRRAPLRRKRKHKPRFEEIPATVQTPFRAIAEIERQNRSGPRQIRRSREGTRIPACARSRIRATQALSARNAQILQRRLLRPLEALLHRLQRP